MVPYRHSIPICPLKFLALSRAGEGKRRRREKELTSWAGRVVHIALSRRIFYDNGDVLLTVMFNMVATDPIEHLKCG